MHQEMLSTSLFLSVSVLLHGDNLPYLFIFLLLPRRKGEVGQEILCGRRLQLHVSAAQPGGRHAVRRSQGGAVRPQPLGHQQEQAAEEREHVKSQSALSCCLGTW